MELKDIVKSMFVKERINENLVIVKKKMQSSSFDYQQLSNSASGDVNVPRWFADNIVSKLDNGNKNVCDLSVGDGQLVISLLENDPSITDVTICDSRIINLEAASVRIKRSFDVNVNTIFYNDVDDLTSKVGNMKFDAVITNPPFFGKGNPQHLRFLSLAHKLSNRYVVFVQPSTYLVDNKKENKFYQDARDLIKDNLTDITLYTKDIFDGAQLNTGVAGIVVDKNTTVTEYNVKYNNLNRTVTFDNIEDINIFASKDMYASVKKKCLAAAKQRNLQDDTESKEDWCVPLPKLQRYRFLPDRAKVIEADEYEGSYAVYYPTKELAEAAFKWLKDPVAIFALHIYKQDMNIASGRNLRSVPSFTTVQDFKNAYDNIGLTPEEVEWCNDIYLNSTDYIKFS